MNSHKPIREGNVLIVEEYMVLWGPEKTDELIFGINSCEYLNKCFQIKL